MNVQCKTDEEMGLLPRPRPLSLSFLCPSSILSPSVPPSLSLPPHLPSLPTFRPARPSRPSVPPVGPPGWGAGLLVLSISEWVLDTQYFQDHMFLEWLET